MLRPIARTVCTPLAYLVDGLLSGRPVAESPVVATMANSLSGLIVLGSPFGLSCDQPRGIRRARSSSLVFPQRAIPAIIGGASGDHIRACASAPRSAATRSCGVRSSAVSRLAAAASSCTIGCMRTSRALEPGYGWWSMTVHRRSGAKAEDAGGVAVQQDLAGQA